MPKKKQLTVSSSSLDITLGDCQKQVYLSNARFRVLVAGRRFGKTQLALVEMVRAAQKPGSLIWYIGPNDHQSKTIAWDRLKAITRNIWKRKPRETNLRIDTIFNSTIVVAGAFNPDSLRGQGLDLLILDEFASQRPSAWAEVFRPALADRKGRALLIGTPKGRNHFYDHFEYACSQADPDWQGFQFTTAQGGFVDAEELESAARQLDPVSFRQEFQAEFTSSDHNRVYYPFDRALHVAPTMFDPQSPLIWSLDFNVNPMCMLLMQRSGDMVYVLSEIVIQPAATTEAACQAFLNQVKPLAARVPHLLQPLKVHVYGDASGNQRRTSGADTDWAIVRQFFQQWRGTFVPTYFTAKANPAVRDRVNCVNSRLRNQLGEVRIAIDPQCRFLLKDLEKVAWIVEPNGTVTAEIDKTDHQRTHASDALGYYISEAFPLKSRMGEKPNPLILH